MAKKYDKLMKDSILLNNVVTAYNYGRKYGLTKKDVAKIYHRRKKTVEKILKVAGTEHGVLLLGENRGVYSKRIYEDDSSQMLGQYNKGMKVKEIAYFHGVSTSSIYRHLRKEINDYQSLRKPVDLEKGLEGKVEKTVEMPNAAYANSAPKNIPMQSYFERIKQGIARNVVAAGLFLSLLATPTPFSTANAQKSANIPNKATVSYVQQNKDVKPYPDKNSIVDYLKSKGYASDIKSRESLYKTKFGENSIYPYENNAKENEALLKALKKNPNYFKAHLDKAQTVTPQAITNEDKLAKIPVEENKSVENKTNLEQIQQPSIVQEQVTTRQQEIKQETTGSELNYTEQQKQEMLKIMPKTNFSSGRNYQLVQEQEKNLEAYVNTAKTKSAGNVNILETLNKVPIVGILIPDPERTYTKEEIKKYPFKTYLNEDVNDKRFAIGDILKVPLRELHKRVRKVPLVNYTTKIISDAAGNIIDKILIIGKDGNEIGKGLLQHPVKTIKEKPGKTLEVIVVNGGIVCGLTQGGDKAAAPAAPAVVETAPVPENW